MNFFWRKNDWPRKTVKLADGREIVVAELAIDAPVDVLAAIDDFENLFVRAKKHDGPEITTQQVMLSARRAVEALRKNNDHCKTKFVADGCRFTLVDVLAMVDASYGSHPLGKASAPLLATANGCAPSSTRDK
jgi:hypothetical protein